MRGAWLSVGAFKCSAAPCGDVACAWTSVTCTATLSERWDAISFVMKKIPLIARKSVATSSKSPRARATLARMKAPKKRRACQRETAPEYRCLAPHHRSTAPPNRCDAAQQPPLEATTQRRQERHASEISHSKQLLHASGDGARAPTTSKLQEPSLGLDESNSSAHAVGAPLRPLLNCR